METTDPKKCKNTVRCCRDCNTDIRQDRFADHIFKKHKEGIKNHILKIGRTIVPLEYQYQFLCLVCEKVFSTKKKVEAHILANTTCSLDAQRRIADVLLGKAPLGETLGETKIPQNPEIRPNDFPQTFPPIEDSSNECIDVCNGCGEWEEIYERDLSEAQNTISKQQEEIEALTKEIQRLWAKYPDEIDKED